MSDENLIKRIGTVELGVTSDYSALLVRPNYMVYQKPFVRDVPLGDVKYASPVEFIQSVPGNRFYDFNKYLRGERTLGQRAVRWLIAVGLSGLVGLGLAEIQKEGSFLSQGHSLSTAAQSILDWLPK